MIMMRMIMMIIIMIMIVLFRIVSWDRLSAEELRVTMMPRVGSSSNHHKSWNAEGSTPNTDSVASATRPSACALGDVDVCNVPGCR